MAQLRVVRFRSSGAGLYFELALCIPRSDGSTTKVIYGNREVMCDTRSLCKALVVHVANMLKKYSWISSEKEQFGVKDGDYDFEKQVSE